MKNCYLITGVGGHLGNTLARTLLESGAAVRGLALPHEDVSMLHSDDLTVFRGDVRDPASLEPLFEGVDGSSAVLIHTAGVITVASKEDPLVEEVNVNGTKNIIALCRAHRIRRLIYISSVHAIPELPAGQTIREIRRFVPEPVVGQYAKTKAVATQLVLDAAGDGLETVVIHPSGIIGPGDYGKGHLTQVVISFLSGSLTACVRGGYDIVDVRDVALGIIAAAERGRSGECYILSNRYVDVAELLDRLAAVSGARRVKTVLPQWFIRPLAPVAELYYKIRRESPLFTRYSLYTLLSNSIFSHEKASDELGYRPRDFTETLRDTVNFLVRERNVKIRLPRRRRAHATA